MQLSHFTDKEKRKRCEANYLKVSQLVSRAMTRTEVSEFPSLSTLLSSFPVKDYFLFGISPDYT